MDNHDRGTITAVDYTTGLATITVGGVTGIIAQVLGDLPVVGAEVYVSKRGVGRSDWVVTDVQQVPFYFEEWDYSGFSVPNNAGTNVTPQNLVLRNSSYSGGASAWSGTAWTAPATGIYTINATGKLGAAGQNAYIRIQTGGGNVLWGNDQGGLRAQVLGMTTGGIGYYASGQSLIVQMFQTSGGAQVQDTNCRVSVFLHKAL